jgi:hypothetical protein
MEGDEDGQVEMQSSKDRMSNRELDEDETSAQKKFLQETEKKSEEKSEEEVEGKESRQKTEDGTSLKGKEGDLYE